MDFKKLNNKAQGLPLNTVVLAILVILVLVIIIVYFTSNMSKTGDSLDQNTDGVNACKVGSYIIPGDKYDAADQVAGTTCTEALPERIYSAKTAENHICCAKRKTSTATTTTTTCSAGQTKQADGTCN